MVQLHVEASVRPGMRENLIHTYQNVFLPAIARQDGFRACCLLVDMEESDRCEILISFATEPLRQRWVASDDHRRAWPAMERCLADIKDKRFDVVAGRIAPGIAPHHTQGR